MNDLILVTVAKLIIKKRLNIFLTVGPVDYFARWVGFHILPDLIRPDSPKLTM